MVTTQQLDAALQAWARARDRAVLEHQAWAEQTQRHDALIAALREQGHGWSGADTALATLPAAHRASMEDADRALDECARAYRHLRAAYRTQRP